MFISCNLSRIFIVILLQWMAATIVSCQLRVKLVYSSKSFVKFAFELIVLFVYFEEYFFNVFFQWSWFVCYADCSHCYKFRVMIIAFAEFFMFGMAKRLPDEVTRGWQLENGCMGAHRGVWSVTNNDSSVINYTWCLKSYNFS